MIMIQNIFSYGIEAFYIIILLSTMTFSKYYMSFMIFIQ